ALRKAKEIDPKSFDARVGLALLLERGRGGQRDPAESRFSEAADEIRSLRELLATDGLKERPDERLLEAEFFAGLWSEVVTDAPRITGSELRDAFALAARAAWQGPAAALKDAERIGNAATRVRVLARSANFLETARLYAV